MMDDGAPEVIKDVGPGHEPLSEETRARLTQIRHEAAVGGQQMVLDLNSMGVQVDVGMEAMAHFRQFLVWIGVITPDQKLVAETLWEVELHQQLRASVRKVKEMAGPGQALIAPTTRLMGPNGRPL